MAGLERLFGGSLPGGLDEDVDPTALTAQAPDGARLLDKAASTPLPSETGPKGAGGAREPMSDTDYQAAIDGAISAAENYVDEYLTPDRERAADYYNGEPFGDEEMGKSDIVITEVRDSILSTLPDLMRVFSGSTNAVEFASLGGADPDVADQQTDYINHIFNVDNPGFRITMNVFKDALRGRLGIVTWWHEDREIVSEQEFSDIPQDALVLLQDEAQSASDNSTAITFKVEIDQSKTRQDQDADGSPMTFVSGVVKRHFIQKRFRVRALPPEEFIFTPATSDELEDFYMVGTRSITTYSRLIEQGYDRAKIEALMDDAGVGMSGGRGSGAGSLETNAERVARDPAVTERIFDAGFDAVSAPSREVKVNTSYILIDRDNDGIAERRKIVTVGDRNAVIRDEVYGNDKLLPYGLYCPDPEPHTPIGQSLADQTMDLQEIKSQLVRRALDSLDQSINSRLVVVEGQTNLDDVLNSENGAVIRTKVQGAVQQLQTQFQGAAVLPVLSYFDEVRTRRTGQSTNPTGLDADVLQSTTKSAADAMVEGAAARSEMIARIFAETGHSRLFRGLLQLVCAHQDYKRTLRLRGTVKTVDPRAWTADVDLQVNVGVGRGKQAQRIQSLMTIAQKQEETYKQYGPGNPFVSFDQISYTMGAVIREMGFSDPSKFFTQIDKATAQKIAQQLASVPKAPTPEELLLQAEREKLGTDAALKREKMRLEEIIALLTNSREREKNEQTFVVAAASAAAQYGAQVDQGALDREQAEHSMIDQAVQTELAIAAGAGGAVQGAGGAPVPGQGQPPAAGGAPGAPTPPQAAPQAPANPAPAPDVPPAGGGMSPIPGGQS